MSGPPLNGLSESPPRSATVRLRLGTRGSKLALAQANKMSELLAAQGHEAEIVTIRTSGDKGDRDRLGAFVREIQTALLNREVDVALHCLKDLPTTPVDGLALSAYLEREDPRDTLISRGLNFNSLPDGSVIGTGSLRRTSQIAYRLPDVVFKPLVGNVDTRMRKLMAGEYDAIVLAIAGLKRLGLLEEWESSEYRELTVFPVSVETIVPAPGQAVLVLETRADDTDAIEAVLPLHHPATSAESRAERAFLHAFGGGCSVPVGAYATTVEGRLRLGGRVSSPDGRQQISDWLVGPDENPEALGAQLAEIMGNLGAFDIVQRVLRDRDAGVSQ